MKLRMTKFLALLAAVLLLAEGLAVAAPKTEAAEAVNGATSAATAQKPMEMLLERDGFINGINYLWIDDGHTFADNHVYGFDTNTFTDGDGEATVYNDMYNIKALGYNAIHITLQGGRMEGVIFDENGHILGLEEEYKKNFRRFLEILDETDTYFMAFLQFHTTKIYSELGKVAWDHATQYYGNDDVRQEYIDLVMRPLLEIVRDFDHRLLALSLGDELENEINDVDADWNYDLDRAVYGVSFDDMYGFYSDMNDLCKEVMPETPRTIGTNWSYLWKYSELDLDFIGRNIYSQYGDDFSEIGDDQYKTGLPMYFPEWGINCWTYPMDYDTFIERNILMLNEIKARGYIGGFFWRYEHTKKSDAELTMYNTFWEYPSDYNLMATTFAYEAIDDENARLGIAPKLDTPKMFAYHGDGLVTWLTARQGDTFDLERSLDGGKTWTKILAGVKKSECLAPRNKNIGYYVDTTVAEDAEALYRVRAYGAGTSTLSEPSQQVVHRKDLAEEELPAGVDQAPVEVDPAKNLIKNGDFEDGIKNWSASSNLTYELMTGGKGHVSDAAVMISDKTNRWGRIAQDFALEANRTYRVTFSYRDMTLNGNATMSVQMSPDGNFTTESEEYSVDIEAVDTAWHTIDVTFTTGENTYGRIRFMPAAGTGINFYIDNVHVELVEATNTDESNLIPNGNFSAGDKDWGMQTWASDAVCEVKDGIGPDGSAAVEFTSASSWKVEASTAIIPVEPNTTYTLEYDMYHQKGQMGGVFIKGGKSATSADDSIKDTWPSGEAGVWTHQSVVFDSGDYTYVRIAFGNTIDGEIYRVDNVSLKAPDPYANLITNNDFSSGNAGWGLSNWSDNGYCEVKPGVGPDGSAAVEFYSPADWTVEVSTAIVPVQPNTTYVLEYDMYQKNGGLGGVFVKGGASADRANDAMVEMWPTAEAGKWNHQSLRFNTGDYAFIRVAFANTVAGETYRLDNVSLKMFDISQNLVSNSDFSSGDTSWGMQAWDSNSYCTVKQGIGPDGSAAAEFGGSKSWTAELTTTIFPVEPNTDYMLTYDVYSQYGYMAGVFVKGGTSSTSANNDIAVQWPAGEKGSWKSQTFYFNSGDYTFVRIAFANANDREVYRVDNVSVTQSAAMPIRHTVTSYNPSLLVAMNDSLNVIADRGFETGDGPWNCGSMLENTPVTVKSDGTAKYGDKYLEFKGEGLEEQATAVFYVPVEPNEEYTFSAWIRSKGLGPDNDGDVTIGIVDPATGNYLVGDPLFYEDGFQKDFSATRCLVPTAFDDAWHLRGMTFLTEEMTEVGIMIRGTNAQLCVDELTLCLASRSTKHFSEKNSTSIVTKMYLGDNQCAPADNLIPNYNLESSDLSFWSDVHGFGRFVTVSESKNGYGNALHYVGDDNPLGYTAIRWVDVQPNTKYVMSFNLKVLRDGEGYFGLMDGKDAHAYIFDRAYFDSKIYGNGDNWLNLAFCFESGPHTRIGLVIRDDGGEALIDNLRLFEQSKATTAQDLYTSALKVTNNVTSGKTASVKVNAQGDGLKYKWYFKDKGSSKFSLTSSFTGATYSIAMNADRNGRQVYCVVTDKYGVSRKTATTTLTMKKTALKITTQPKTSTYVKDGATAKVTVKAQGDGLKYAWYFKNAGKTSYSKSSITTATYSVKMSSAASDRRLYCVITDAYGNKVQTQTVLIRRQVAITKQPATANYAKNGAKVSVKITASGDGLKYAWYVKNASAKKYTKSSITKSTYTVTMSDTVKGRRVYCVVTDKYGKTVTSKTAILRMAATITTQPKTTTVKKNATAKLTVKAKGDGLKYTWYYKNAGSKKFTKVSGSKSTYSVKMTSKVKNRQVYVVVTDKYGKKVQSKTVTLKMK